MDDLTEDELVPLAFEEEQEEIYGDEVVRESAEARTEYRQVLDEPRHGRPVGSDRVRSADAESRHVKPKTLVLGVAAAVLVAGVGFLVGSSGSQDGANEGSPNTARITQLEQKLDLAQAKIAATRKARAAKERARKIEKRREARRVALRNRKARLAAKRETAAVASSSQVGGGSSDTAATGESYSYSEPSYSAPAPAPAAAATPAPSSPPAPAPATASEAANAFSPLP